LHNHLQNLNLFTEDKEMKVSLKLLKVLFVIATVASLAACAPAASTEAVPAEAAVESAASAPGEAAATDGRYPAETVKICVETFDPADTQYMDVQAYFESLAENVFNVEYIFSEKIESAEQELQFIENCAAAGGKGLIAYYNVSKGQAVAQAADLGIYYWGIAEEQDVYAEYKDNPYYLGSVILGNGDYDGMYAVTKALLEQGKTKLIYANGGADFGITMFVNRRLGFQAAVDEAKAAGADVTVTEVPGFPNEAWFAAQGAALAGDVDAVIGSFGADVWVQPIAAAGKAGTVSVGSFGGITDFYKQTFADGSVSAIAAEPTERFGIAVAQIVNAVDGNADALKENGMATNTPQSLWIVTNPEAFTTLYDYEKGDGRAHYSTELVNLVKNLNPEASAATLQELIAAYSLESLLAGK
jgi:hypothetical protein